jgi:multiple sugar transport system substrate-binding protein
VTKKLFFLCNFIVLLSLVLTGCGANAQSSQNQPVTLRYAIWDQNQVPALQQMVTAFKKTHPNISVDIEVTPFAQYFTKLQTAISGGSAPDVFWMNGPNFGTYASNGVLMPLDNMISSGQINMSNYPASLVSLYTYNGKQYAIPKDFDTVGLWYNKKLFDAAGVKYPDSSWNWNTLTQAAKKLTNPSKGVWGIAAPMVDQEGFYNTIPQAGGFVISANKKTSGFDNPASIQGLQFWTNLIQDKSSPTLAQMTDTLPLSMFESGKVAMMYGGSWDALVLAQDGYTKTNVNVTVLPEGKTRATVIHGQGIAISASTKHPQQAKEFAAFLGSKQAANILGETGTVIPAFNGTQQNWVKAFPQYDLQSFLDELPYAIPYPTSINAPEWQNVQNTVLNKVWAGQMPPAQGGQQIATQMNQILASGQN